MPKLSEIDNKPPEFMKVINEFVVNPKGFLLISGSNGNGKSFASRAIFENFWHPHTDNKWWNQADLNFKHQEVWAEYKTTKHLLDDIVNAPLLVLDDIGTRKPTDSFMDFLYVLADKRFALKHIRGTIITTNLNSKSMREMFGDAFVSRVASGLVLRYDGPDRRCINF